MKRKILLFTICFVVLCISTVPVNADMYSFALVTANTDGAIATQLSFDVADIGYNPVTEKNQVLFTFSNNLGPIDGSITEIYFDDGALLGLAEIQDYPPDVDFIQGATPSEPPGGNTLVPEFHTTADFSVDVLKNTAQGVNQGESVGIVFDLKEGKTFNDVITDLGYGFNDPSNPDSLRIAIHVRSIPWDGGITSDTFILTPIPAAVLLGIFGLGVVGIKLRKFA